MNPDQVREAIRRGLLGPSRQIESSAPVATVASRGYRCVLCNAGPDIELMVNRMIVGGATYAQAHRALSPINEARISLGEPEISYQTVQRHGRDHLPAKSAAIREIVERQARTARLDAEEGTTNIITLAAYAEAMMTKAFQDMVDADISPAEGLQAAKFLNQLIQAERGSVGVETAFAELGYLIAAVKEAVPQQYWSAITAKIEEKRGSRVIDVDSEEFDPGEQPEEDFSPPDDGEDF